MIISFFGHSDFQSNEVYEKKLMSIIDKTVEGNKVDLLLGNYGSFDEFAYHCCKKYKAKNPKASLIFITPYISENYQKLKYAQNEFDLIVYPEIESKPKKYAIHYRNKYMVEKADFIIFYVKRHYGGAYQALTYAKRLNKPFINIATDNGE